MLTPEDYITVSNNPCIFPAHPGTLVIPCNADAAGAVRRENAYQERLKCFRETVDIQKELARQIVTAVESKYTWRN